MPGNFLVDRFVNDLLLEQNLYRRQIIVDNVINSNELSDEDRLEVMIRVSQDSLNKMVEILEYKIMSDPGVVFVFLRNFFIDWLYEYLFMGSDKLPMIFKKYETYATSIKALNSVITTMKYRKFYSQVSKILLPTVNN